MRDDTTLRCRVCGSEKAIGEFYRRSDKPDTTMSQCKACHAAGGRERRRRNPDTWRKGYYRRTFGITLDEYEALLADQGGRCAGCRKADPAGRRLAVDHNHVTGKVRGLLCGHCNRALGLLRDDPAALRRLAEYVERAQ